jgi:tRNA(fMet)-specific endonuclease VapC
MMFVLDTDTITHLLMGHPRVIQKQAEATAEVALTVVSRIEVLQGRFASVLKAEDGDKVLSAQKRLLERKGSE